MSVVGGLWWGLFCFSVMAAEEVGRANQEGGLELETLVADALIAQGQCVLIDADSRFHGYLVYHGRILAPKQVVGISPTETGDPELFGLILAEAPSA